MLKKDERGFRLGNVGQILRKLEKLKIKKTVFLHQSIIKAVYPMDL
jgi:hypothetical protein